MNTLSKKLMSILLVFTLLLTSVLSTNVVFAEGEEEDNSGLTWELVEPDKERASKQLNTVKKDSEKKNETKRSKTVRVSIVLESDATINNGYSVEKIGEDPGAIAYREALKNQQDKIAETISAEVLGGNQLDVVWNLTLAANIISANVPEDKIEEIKALDGVKDVFIETEYYPQTDEVNADDPNMTVSTGMTSANYAWAAGYTGAGSKIAIVDTGLDIEHQSFNSTAFDFSLQEIKTNSGRTYDLLDQNDVRRLWSSLNASQSKGTSYEQAYINSKVPYGFNYVDEDFDITHVNDTQGEHGSHVASIAAANKYIYSKDEDGSISLKSAYSSVRSLGNAPDAQLLVMKVFGKNGGAYDSDYFAAIEDAIVLGADSVNLSLGSSSAGFSRNSTYQDIIDSLTFVSIVWTNSAGNNGSWADNTNAGYLYSDGVSLATGGSPATYSSSMSVASVDNDGASGNYLVFADNEIFFTETYSNGNTPMAKIAGDYEFVYVDAYGTEGDFAAVSDVLDGKIAICNRGGINFAIKVNNAVNNGAVAVIIANNQPGTISMSLNGVTNNKPAVSITKADAEFIKSKAELMKEEGGVKYYTGTIKVSGDSKTKYYDEDFYTMSSFSSYGVPGDLSMKPEITAPGGNIYAAFGLNQTKTDGKTYIIGGHDLYENMSGTSMAAPQMAGIVAVMAQFAKENGLLEEANRLGITRRALIQSLLMSTARPLIEKESGSYFSVLKQGAGLADVEAAINSNMVVLMKKATVNGEARKDISVSARDGKVKAELGDDPSRSGKYSIEFTLNNISDTGRYYDLDGSFFTQDLFTETYRYMDTWTTFLNPSIAWFIDGDRFVKEISFDFNGDQIFNEQDAQVVLDYVAGKIDTFSDMDDADLDNDGQITTHDAYAALKIANQGAAYVPAKGTVTIRADIAFDEDINEFDDNGAYIEGYLFANERESNDGAIGVSHSIPVLGYYGSWSDPSMIDVGSSVEYGYELEERPPYMANPLALNTDAYDNQLFFVDLEELNATIALGGNPLGAEYDNGIYMPERNALNSNNLLYGSRYSLIRNAAGVKTEIYDEQGNIVKDFEHVSNSYGAFYYANEGVWRSTSYVDAINYRPKELSEGFKGEIAVSFAPEYYQSKDGTINWDEVSPDMKMNFVVDNTSPLIERIIAKRLPKEVTYVDVNGAEQTVASSDIVITIAASDNEYIAGLEVYDENNRLLHSENAREGAKKTERDEEEYAVILEDASNIPDHLYVDIYDYAANLTSVQINLNKKELEEPIEIALDETYVKTVVNSPYPLEATITPWGSKDQEVIWSSSDESIAVVNEKGVVTGLREGKVVITATAHADTSKSVSCEFEFITIERTLRGLVWDEEGQVWLSEFQTNDLPNYKKLSEALDTPLASATYAEDGLLYAASLNTDDLVSGLYTIDENSFEVNKIGDSSIGYTDLSPAPSLGGDKLLATYGTYIIIVDRVGGDYIGAFNMASFTGNRNIVALAYEEQYDHPNYGLTDWVFFIDTAGNLYETGFLPYGGSYSRFNITSLGNLGYSTDTSYFQSLYYDGVDLYWSRYVAANDKVDIVFVKDIFEDGTIFNLGSFNTSVWPVGGLYNDDLKTLIGIGDNDHSDALVDEEAQLETVVTSPQVNTMAVKGSLNSFEATDITIREDIKPEVDGDTDASSKQITITLTADSAETTNNGLYEVSFDPAIMSYAYADTKLPYYAVNNEEGKIIFAFADLEGVAMDEVVAKLVFDRISTDRTVISVKELESGTVIDHEAPAEEIKVKDPTEDFGEIIEEDRPEYEELIPEGLWLSPLSDLVYTGKAQTQEFRVYNHKKLLKEGTDYTVTYSNNKKTGTAKVKVTGKGNYTGSVTKTFEILPADISNDTIVILNKDAFLYNGKKQKASVSAVMFGGVKLASSNYTVTYLTPDSKDVGVYFIEVEGKGNYNGKAVAVYSITDRMKLVSNLNISGVKNKTYTGTEILQDIVVKDGKNILTEGKDYSIMYKNNINAGTAYVVIFGEGDYLGSVTKAYKINPIKLTAKNSEVEGLPQSVSYSDVSIFDTMLKYNDLALTENVDYTVTYKNNAKAGTATVTFKGINNYSGSFSKTFKITAIALSDIQVGDISAQAYQKDGNKPDVKIYDTFNGVDLILDKDYTLTYSNNKKQGTATVTIKGKGNYSGTIKKTFEISAADLGALKAEAADKAYSKKKNAYKSALTITDVNGKKLAAGTDYDKSVVYTYENDTKLDGGINRQAGAIVEQNDIPPAGTVIRVTAYGKGNYYGSVSTTYRITFADFTKVSVKIPNQIYTGEEIKLDKAEMTIKLNKVKLEAEDFEIVSYKNNINKGTAAVTIKGVGNYGGTKTAQFKIVKKSFINAIWALFN